MAKFNKIPVEVLDDLEIKYKTGSLTKHQIALIVRKDYGIHSLNATYKHIDKYWCNKIIESQQPLIKKRIQKTIKKVAKTTNKVVQYIDETLNNNSIIMDTKYVSKDIKNAVMKEVTSAIVNEEVKTISNHYDILNKRLRNVNIAKSNLLMELMKCQDSTWKDKIYGLKLLGYDSDENILKLLKESTIVDINDSNKEDNKVVFYIPEKR